MQTFKAHAGAIAALTFCLIAGLFMAGCQVKTSSIEHPGSQVSVNGLNQEIARAQAKLDKQGADVQALAAQVTTANSKYLADAKELQGEVDAAETEAQQKVDSRRQILNLIPVAATSIIGQVATGHIDPLSLLGSLLATASPILAIGAGVDSVRKTIQVKQLTKPWDGQDRRGDDSKPAGDSGAPQSLASAPPATKLAA